MYSVIIAISYLHTKLFRYIYIFIDLPEYTIPALCRGQDPTSLKFDQVILRSHLMKCFYNNQLTRFPSTVRRQRAKHPAKKQSVDIFCSCRRTYNPKTQNMVQCHQCREWYHDHCEKITVSDLQGKAQVYQCSYC